MGREREGPLCSREQAHNIAIVFGKGSVLVGVILVTALDFSAVQRGSQRFDGVQGARCANDTPLLLGEGKRHHDAVVRVVIPNGGGLKK